MQPERLAGRESGVQPCGWLRFDPSPAMETPALDSAISHLQWALTHLHEATAGRTASLEVSTFLDPGIEAVLLGYQTLTAARDFLRSRAEP